jgi:hypothetical protein
MNTSFRWLFALSSPVLAVGLAGASPWPPEAALAYALTLQEKCITIQPKLASTYRASVEKLLSSSPTPVEVLKASKSYSEALELASQVLRQRTKEELAIECGALLASPPKDKE